MAKFNFRFASYLSVKEKLEDQKKLDYAKALKALELEKQKKRQMEHERREAINSIKNKLKVKISAAEVQRHNSFLAYIKEAIAKQEKVIKKAEDVAEDKRLLLVEAMKDRKTIEKLKERDFDEFIFQTKKDEEKATDEVVSFKFKDHGY